MSPSSVCLASPSSKTTENDNGVIQDKKMSPKQKQSSGVEGERSSADLEGLYSSPKRRRSSSTKSDWEESGKGNLKESTFFSNEEAIQDRSPSSDCSADCGSHNAR